MKKRVLIGITLDYESGGGYSAMPWYALRCNYFAPIFAMGGSAIALPHFPDAVSHFAEIIDGIIIPGGNFDINPEYYGQKDIHKTVMIKDARTSFEYAITKRMIELKKPILGICGGEQLINVVMGGSLIQHIPDAVPDCLEHEQKTPRNQPAHRVKIKAGTLLHRIIGADEAMVNTSHHQAVKDVGDGIIVNCHADDGIIEGIEMPTHPFCLGVQWHPEYEVTSADNLILQAFFDSANRA